MIPEKGFNLIIQQLHKTKSSFSIKSLSEEILFVNDCDFNCYYKKGLLKRVFDKWIFYKNKELQVKNLLKKILNKKEAKFDTILKRKFILKWKTVLPRKSLLFGPSMPVGYNGSDRSSQISVD